jgi:hypothetical protein
MQVPAGEQLRRSPDWIFAAAAAVALATVIWLVVASGSWLDEYWQLWISGAPTQVLASRLLADAHPPWFNLFARAVVLLTDGQLVPARLINLAGAIALLGVGLSRIGGLDRSLRWRMFLLIVASAGAVGMAGLAPSFRAYVWLITLSALQAALLATLILKRPVPFAMTALVTTGSIAVHYVHAAGAISIALVSIALAWKTHRPAARAILIGLAIGIALDLATGLVQLPRGRALYDVNWIAQSGGGGAFSTFAAVGSDFVICNGIAAAMLAVGLVARRSKAALMLLAPIPLALIGWLILDASVPILLPRYMASVTALLATAAAVSWAELALAPVADAALALLAALQPLAGSFIRPPLAGWEAGARVAAEVTRACPQAELYAVSPWRFRDQPGSRMEQFEDPVIASGYRRVGKAFGLDPSFVTGPTAIQLGRCPAIIWVESAHGIESVPPEAILKHAQLSVPEPAKARVVPTPSGAVLLISPANRMGRGS